MRHTTSDSSGGSVSSVQGIDCVSRVRYFVIDSFDGNWEAMSSDIVFEPDLQRCIGVDVRYMLFIMEKYGKAANLIEELKLTR